MEPCCGDGRETQGQPPPPNPMTKVCMDHVTSLGACPDRAPPLYLCVKCVDGIKENQSNVEVHDIFMPMSGVSTSCENKVSILYLCINIEIVFHSYFNFLRKNFHHRMLNIPFAFGSCDSCVTIFFQLRPWNVSPDFGTIITYYISFSDLHA